MSIAETITINIDDYNKMKAELKDKVMTWENISKKKTNALIPFFKKLDIDYSPAFDGGDYIEECLEKVSVKIAELKEKIEKRRLVNCRKSEELVKALSPWKKDHQDHKRILEVIGELKQENEKLKEEIDGDTFWGVNIGLKKEKSNLITQLKRLVKENAKLKQENEKLKKEKYIN